MSGGKGGTSTSTVQIPPEVLARYNSVNANAEKVAQTPFQQYSGQFVAPLSATQQSGVANTNAAAMQAQPYYSGATSQLVNAQGAYQPYQTAATQGVIGAAQGAQPYQTAATGLALGAAGPVNAQSLDIGKYMNPYLGTVLGSTAALLNQNNQQAMAGQLGNAITSGAFGGDRAGIAAANLSQQQNLANANIYSGIASQGFNTALGAAQQQQGVNLSADQANRAALLNASSALAGLGQQGYTQQLGAAQALAGLGQQGYNVGANTATTLAGLGAGAQSAALQGAQAQLAAGQTEQQTAQAQDTALYNQFLQEKSYPFQTAQFLANIAEGTGSLSGNTTTTNTVQNGIFSDKRLKENIKPIGKTFDGQTIYSYRYKGEKHTEIGLMAQEVEKGHPEAVGLARGYKTVHYGKATDDAAKRGHFASGGLVPANDREGYYGGGLAYAGEGYNPAATAQLMANYQAMYGPLLAHGGAGGAGGIVPSANLPVQSLQPASAPSAPMGQGLAGTVTDWANTAGTVGELGDKLKLWKYGEDSGGSEGAKEKSDKSDWQDTAGDKDSDKLERAGGGSIPYLDGESAGLDIPNDQQRYQLKTAQTGDTGGGGGGLVGGIGKVAGTGLAVAKLLPMLGLSDKRAKENIKPVGKTFDGQTVYTYNYKGDSTPRMGLIAQEVEKHHPGAVGIARGLKTVDYAKATTKAAKRGHFAAGGDVGDYSDLVNSTLKNVKDTYEAENKTVRDAIDEEDGHDASAAPADTHTKTDTDKTPAPVAAASPASAASGNGPVIKTSGKGTRADRNNNPGNIEAGSFAKKMPGYVGTDGRFAVFDTPEAGRNAQLTLLKGYVQKGYDTPAKIANRWAPGSEKGNNPSQYAGFIASRLGIGLNDKITADMLPKFASAQGRMEGATKRGALATGGRAGYATAGAVGDDDGLDEANSLTAAFDADPSLRKRAEAIAAAKQVAAPAPAPVPANDTAPVVTAPETSAPVAKNELALGSGATGLDRLPSSVNPDQALPSSVSAPHDIDVRPKHGFFKGLGHGDATSWLPLLSGIGALATTQTNNPLTALAAGLGAGATTAQQQRDFALKQQEAQIRAAQNQQQLGVSQGQYQIAKQLLPYQQAQTAGAAAATRAHAIAELQDAAIKSVGSASAQMQFAMMARSYLQGGVITPEDLHHITAPQSAGELSQMPIGGVAPAAPTPLPGAPALPAPAAPAGGLAPPAPTAAPSAAAPSAAAPSAAAPVATPVSATPAEQPAQRSIADVFPNLAATKPLATPTAPANTSTPFDAKVNPGDGVRSSFYRTNPEWQEAQKLNGQADALASTLAKAPALAKTPYGEGLTSTIATLREQANQHRTNAENQFQASAAPAAKAIGDKTEVASSFITDLYPRIANATKNAAEAAATSNLNNDSTAWSKTIGVVASMFPGIVPDSALLAQGSAEKSELNRMYLQMFSLKGTGISARAEGTELNTLNKYGANHPGPAAGYDFVVKTRALAERQKQYSDDLIRSAPSITNESQWTAQWAAKHPLSQYVESTVQSTPLAKGMTLQQATTYIPPARSQQEVDAQVKKGNRYVNLNGQAIAEVRRDPHAPRGYKLIPWTGQ